jgi:hypothetical protein
MSGFRLFGGKQKPSARPAEKTADKIEKTWEQKYCHPELKTEGPGAMDGIQATTTVTKCAHCYYRRLPDGDDWCYMFEKYMPNCHQFRDDNQFPNPKPQINSNVQKIKRIEPQPADGIDLVWKWFAGPGIVAYCDICHNRIVKGFCREDYHGGKYFRCKKCFRIRQGGHVLSNRQLGITLNNQTPTAHKENLCAGQAITK